MNNGSQRIQSPEFAEHIAYAEKPFRDLAYTASSLGALTIEVSTSFDAQANQAGLEAAHDYIKALQDNITPYNNDVEPKTTYSLANEEFTAFAAEHGFHKNMAQRVWWAFVRFAGQDDTVKETRNPHTLDIEELTYTRPLTAIGRDVRGVGDTGLNLLNQYQDWKTSQSSTEE